MNDTKKRKNKELVQETLDQMVAKSFQKVKLPYQLIEETAIQKMLKSFYPEYQPPSKRRLMESLGPLLIHGRRPRVLLAATGSVATVKIPEIASKLAFFGEVFFYLSTFLFHISF